MWTALALLGVGIASAIAGAIATNSAQKKANEANLKLNEENNKTNIELAEKEMAFNSAEAEKQRVWEEEQSNTAVQRRMSDLEAAGVNPMLALGSPAQTMSGATASATSARTQAGSVEPENGVGQGLAHLASMAQSAAFMMALGKIKGDQAKSYQSSHKQNYVQNNFNRYGMKTGFYTRQYY